MTRNLSRNRSEDEKFFRGVFFGMLGVWVLAALTSIGLTVAVIWAIVKVVQHFT